VRDAGRDARCSVDKRASSPAGSSRLLGTTCERHRRPSARYRNARSPEGGRRHACRLLVSMAVALDLTADAPARVLKQHCQTLRAEPGPADASPAPPSNNGRVADSSTGVSGPNFNRLTDAERVFTRQRSQGCRVCWSWGPSRPQTPWSAPSGRGDIRMTGWVCGSTLDECNGREGASIRHAPAVVSRSASTSRSGASHPR
jgi:hypothetical protein